MSINIFSRDNQWGKVCFRQEPREKRKTVRWNILTVGSISQWNERSFHFSVFSSGKYLNLNYRIQYLAAWFGNLTIVPAEDCSSTPILKWHEIIVNIHIFFTLFRFHTTPTIHSVDLNLLSWYGPRKDAKFIVHVQAIRLFQRYKTTNANTVTASNGPTMKYHCTVVLAETKK